MPAIASAPGFLPLWHAPVGTRTVSLLLCLLLFSQVAALAAEPPLPAADAGGMATGLEPVDAAGPTESLLETGLDFIDHQQAMISNGLLSSSEWLDSFFWDRSIEVEEQQTRLRVTLSLLADERNGAEFDGGAHFRLSLPALNERLQLLISDDGDDETTFALDPSRTRWEPRERTEEGLMAGFRYFFTHTAKRNSSFRVSLRLRDGNPALLLEPRYRQDFLLDDWLLRFTQRFVAYTNGDLQVRTLFNLNRPLIEWSPDLFFRAHAEGIWFQDRDGYFYHVDFTLLQKLRRDRDLEYAWINELQTRPEHRLETVRLRLAYRQPIHWDWLFLEVAPQVVFPRDKGWQPEFGILLRLDIYFGACK